MKPHPVVYPNHRPRLAVGAAIALFGCVVVSYSAPATRRDDKVITRDGVTTTVPAIKRADRDFLEKAAKAGMEEVQISRVAAERSTNPDVRKLAQMIIADHEDANAELTTLAANRGVALPARDITADNKWTKRDAKGFDVDYLDKMVNAHEDAVKLFERQARNGDDPDAVAYARKHLPALQHHLQQAIDLKRLLK